MQLQSNIHHWICSKLLYWWPFWRHATFRKSKELGNCVCSSSVLCWLDSKGKTIFDLEHIEQFLRSDQIWQNEMINWEVIATCCCLVSDKLLFFMFRTPLVRTTQTRPYQCRFTPVPLVKVSSPALTCPVEASTWLGYRVGLPYCCNNTRVALCYRFDVFNCTVGLAQLVYGYSLCVSTEHCGVCI